MNFKKIRRKVNVESIDIAGLYETRLAKENPNAGQVQYRAEDLFRFIDTYKEFVALVFDTSKAVR